MRTDRARQRFLTTALLVIVPVLHGVTFEQNRFDSLQDQMTSYSVDTYYDNGAPRFVWLDEPASVELSIGTVELAYMISLFPNGLINTADFRSPQRVTTPVGTIDATGVTFHENGQLHMVHFEDDQTIATPMGDAVARQYVTFHENGSVDEFRLARPRELSGAFGTFMADSTVGFDARGALALMEARVPQTVFLPDGSKADVELIRLHENGVVSLVQFDAPRFLETPRITFNDAILSTFNHDGTYDIVGVIQPLTYETPGGTFEMLGVALLPDGNPAGGILTAPYTAETVAGAIPLAIAIFREDGSLQRAAPLDVMTIDGLEYDYRSWMVFDPEGNLTGQFLSELFY